MAEMCRDWFFAIKPGKDFVLFNDEPLSMEPVEDGDLAPIGIPAGSPWASMAWSCDAEWYFVIGAEGIALLNVFSNKGYLCKRKTAMFIEHFLDAPARQSRVRSKRRKGETPDDGL